MASAASGHVQSSSEPPGIQAHFLNLEVQRAFEAGLAEAGDIGATLYTNPHQRPAAPSTFDGQRYMQRLRTKRLGHVLLSAKEISSTQDFMRSSNARLGGHIVMVADRQVSGKGRGSNVWTSPDGCLMFTAGCPVKVVGSQAPFINYVVCLAVVMGVRDCLEPVLQVEGPLLVGNTNKGVPIDVRIKWPNDVYSGGLKIAGALIHTTWSHDRFNVFTGIGLNVSNRQPTRCLEEVVSAALMAAGRVVEDSPVVRREDVLAAVINRLEEYFEIFQTHGFAPLEALYLDNWLHSGQRVGLESGALALISPGDDPAAAASVSGATLSATAGAENAAGGTDVRAAGSHTSAAASLIPTPPISLPSPPQQQQMTIRGLSADGFLLAEDGAGRRYELTPDGNSLDMLQGMLRRKLP